MAYEKKGRRLIAECACGKDHQLSHAAMAAVITASSRGLLHRVGVGHVESECILRAFDYPEVMELYDGRPITFH